MHLELADKSIRLTSSGQLSRLIGAFTVFLGLLACWLLWQQQMDLSGSGCSWSCGSW